MGPRQGFALVAALAVAGAPLAGDRAPEEVATGQELLADPHYTPAGFFDVHVCNWPNEPRFFLVLFTTERFVEVLGIEVRRPDGVVLGRLDLDRFKRLVRPDRPEKRAYIRHFPVEPGDPDGWYTASVKLRDGQVLAARDYVVIATLPRATGLEPASEDPPVTLPVRLSWRPVVGARFYQVAIRDLWEEERVVHESPLIDRPAYEVPAGVLRPGGLYAWKVHARDVNEHVLLGDFNQGSQSEWVRLSVEAAP